MLDMLQASQLEGQDGLWKPGSKQYRVTHPPVCVKPALNLWQELHLYVSALPCQSLLREQLAVADRMPQVEGD